MSDRPDAAFDALLEFLRRSRALDFAGYKRASLERRFRRRMESVRCESYADYLDFLEVHPEEFDDLLDTLLINVTEFFRDPPAWEHLAGEVLPGLLAGKAPDTHIRIWSAGCASGEEAYTAAIVLAEALGEDAYRERVKIYATDIDEDALSQARQAVYTAKAIESVPPELRGRYFERADLRYSFRKDLRRTVIFGRNNLVQDAPISRLDLLICRNTLMYFTAETQARILRHFHFALADHGVLMLGKSEMMISHRDLFAPIDMRRRIFGKQPRDSLQGRMVTLANGDALEAPPTDPERATREAALEAGPHAHLVVTSSGTLGFANLAARALFHIPLEDVGRPLADLPVARHPVELRPAVEQAIGERRRVSLGDVAFTPERGEERRLDVTAAPLVSGGNVVLGVSVVFEDVTRYMALQGELEGNRRDLELAYEELQSTIDELETTNEELQSANEELQTTNEELQSTNEELETMNEELQSTNEELETINDELRERTGELNQVNDFLEAILTSLGIGVAVLDAHQRVQVWNRHSEELWGLRSAEALDQHFLSLDIGLPSERLAPDLRAVLRGAERRVQEIAAVNRRGRPIVCEVTLLPLMPDSGDGDGDGQVRGAIVLMEGQLTEGSRALEPTRAS
jgi:two-component system, chemotaxis family, CheB/CheR fusion protein